MCASFFDDERTGWAAEIDAFAWADDEVLPAAAASMRRPLLGKGVLGEARGESLLRSYPFWVH